MKKKGKTMQYDVIDVIEVPEDEKAEQLITDLLVGNKVEKVHQDYLFLSNGTVLRVDPNYGGCGCGDGDYDISELNEVDNIITSVKLHTEGGGWEEYTAYRIFVYAENKKINLLSVTGNDGNGYYGTGYSIAVIEEK